MKIKEPRKYIITALVAFSVIIVDQCTKYFIIKTFPLYSSVDILKNYLTIVHIRNKGIAFGLLAGQGSGIRLVLLIITSLLAVGFIFYLLKTLRDKQRYAIVTLSLILGGAIGNLIDRIRLGEVVDFIDLHWYRYHWPAFNCADSAISIGLVLLLTGIITKRFPSE
jgi:signal peptidase II